MIFTFLRVFSTPPRWIPEVPVTFKRLKISCVFTLLLIVDVVSFSVVVVVQTFYYYYRL